MRNRGTPGRSHEDSIFSIVAGKQPPAAPSFPLIHDSWRRCVERYRLDPARQGQPRILTSNELKDERAPIDDFARLARDEIDRLYAQVAEAGLVVLLTNTRGVTIEYRGDPSLEADLKVSGLYLGSVWAEEVEGTNGVGTCIATRQPLTIFRDEHFRTRNIGLTCTVAPILDPFGEMMAVLDVSSMTASQRASQVLALELVKMSARRLERANIFAQFPRHWVLRLAERPGYSAILAEMLLVADGSGRIVAADSGALSATLPPEGHALLGTTLEAIFAAETRSILHGPAVEAREPSVSLRLHDGRELFASVRPPARCRGPADAGRAAARRPARRRRELSLHELSAGEPALERRTAALRRALALDLPVLLLGETGTGKEAFARAVHAAGPRRDGPFVAVNCAAIPDALIESELFGYRAGAFTGARRQGNSGRFVEADGGTLFLDEIGDMPFALQSRLLRVLSEREVTPLGGGAPVPVDFGLICATHQDLEGLVGEGRFRADLYYRIQGFTLRLPPLRARTDKRALIARLVAGEAAAADLTVRLEPDALEALAARDWPGNIRELLGVARLALAYAEDGVIRSADVSSLAAPLPAASDERERLEAALRRHAWCVSRAARDLGVSRATVHRRIKALGLVSPNRAGARRPG